MKKSKFFMAAAFVLAIGGAFASKANSRLVTQYNFKDPDNANQCTFLSNTDPCGGGTKTCIATVGTHTGLTIYKAQSLDCTTVDSSMP